MLFSCSCRVSRLIIAWLSQLVFRMPSRIIRSVRFNGSKSTVSEKMASITPLVFDTYPYILLTKAYALRNPTVPVSSPYTKQAMKLYVKNSIELTKPVMCSFAK